MADPVFPSLSVIEKREFEPQRWGLDFVMQTAVKQAEAEEAARREALAIKAKELESKRTGLLREASRLEALAGTETGRVLRAEQAIDQDILDAWAKAQNEAERQEVQNRFRARTGNRDADLRAAIANMQQAEINRRAREAGARTGAGRAGRQPLRPPELGEGATVIISDVTSRTAANPAATGGDLFALWSESKERMNYTPPSDRERAYETASVLDEYARKVSDRERARGNNITPEVVADNLIASGTLPPWVLTDLEFIEQELDARAAGAPGAPAIVPTGGLPPATPVQARAVGVSVAEPVMGQRAAPIDTEYIEGIRRRAAELTRELEALDALDVGQPVPLLQRAQQIARAQFGPEAARARLEIRANREANSLIATQFAAKNMVGTDIPADEQRVARLAWDKVEEDPVYQTVKQAVGLGSNLTSWERLRTSIESRYARSPDKLERALAYYKMLRYMKDNRLM